jgi:hypothetical protein
MVWVDNREGNNDIYYAGAMYVGPPLVTQEVDASIGGTVEVNSELQVYIPPGALSTDTTITIAEMINPPKLPSRAFGVFYELCPSGLEFNTQVTITLPHTIHNCPGYSTYRVYWYNAEAGWSQDGITNVQHVEISPTRHAVRFQTTHFTGFGVAGSSGYVPTSGSGGGGGGGGCSVSASCEGNIVEFILPYIGLTIVMVMLKVMDMRYRRASNITSGKF